MKLTKKFAVEVAYFGYDKKLICYVHVFGIGYYDQNRRNKDISSEEKWVKDGNDLLGFEDGIEEYLSFDIEKIKTKSPSGTHTPISMDLWNLKDVISDSLRDVVEKACLSHMEWLFSAEINPTGTNTPDTFEEARREYENTEMHAMRNNE